jgi:hypothetical protein
VETNRNQAIDEDHMHSTKYEIIPSPFVAVIQVVHQLDLLEHTP